MPYEIRQIVMSDLQENCFLLHDADGNAVVIDPGGEPDLVLAAAAEKKLTIREILDTHGHIDHIAGNVPLRRATGARIGIHPDDASRLSDPILSGAAWLGWEFEPHQPDFQFREGDTVGCGAIRFEVVHTPGHSPGLCMLVDRTNGAAFVGDLVFRGSVGRWDLPGGDFETLMRSLREKFAVLPPGMTVYSGHGPGTTVGEELEHNPFLNGEYQCNPSGA